MGMMPLFELGTDVIVDLPAGQVITEPGFYRTPIEWHHSQCCDDVSVTSGVLRKMELATAADVWAFHDLNDEAWPSEDTEALSLGRAMAAFVEGGLDAVRAAFVLLDEAVPRRPTAAQVRAYGRTGEWSEKAREGALFWERVDAEGKPTLKLKDLRVIADMGRALRADPGAVALLDGEPEITMAWRDEETGLWLLSRPDLVNFDGVVADYKRMASGGQPFSHRVVDRRITEHGYDMQLAFAAEVFQRLTGGWPEQAAILAQWDKRPHHCIVREINDEDLRLGQFRNRAALRRFRECLDKSNDLAAKGQSRWPAWPGPGEDTGFYQRPEWLRTELLERLDIETGSGSALGFADPENADETHPFGRPPAADPITLQG